MNTNTNTTNNNHINTSLPTNIINSTSLPSSSSLLPLINSTTTSSTSTIINPSSSIVISSNPTTSRSINNNIPSLEFTSLELWKKLNVIGRGGSSTVYKVELVNNKQIVAMKEIQIDGLTKEQILAIEAEIDTMKSLNHMNIVNYLGTFRQQSNFYIFLEYAEKGSLRQFYQKNGKLTEAQASTCTKSMLLGLLYLHSNGIAHRDIKGANVLLAEGGEMKLADFGASKRLDTASIVSGLKGTPHWMAPEVIKGTQMSTGWMKADVWSLGCTVVEMLTGALPFSEYANPMTAMYHIANGKSPPISDDIIVSKEAREFVSLCCSVEPNDRPSVADLLEHAFITNQTTETYLYPLSSIDAQNIQVQQINTLDILSSSNEESSNKETNLNESINEILIDKEIEKSDKTRLSEGQMVLQKLNRVVVIDVTSKSSSPLLDETNIFQNQVTPVIHHTRKKRNQESPIPIGISNTPTLGNVTMSRNSQLLPPTGKKMDKKSTSNSKSSSPILKLDPISPSSVIRGTTSGEDTDRSSEYHNRTSRSNSTSSTVCATPIMMHDGSNDNYHMNSSCGIASCVSPPIITTELLPDDKLIIEQSIPLKNSTSAFGPRSRSNSGRFEFQIPVTISNNETENEIISPGPSLSRSVSIEDSLIDEKDGVLRPIAPLSGQKINICCELEQPIIIPEPKENRLSEIKEIKLTKKQSLKSIKPENKNMRSPIKQTNKNNNHNNHNNNHHHHHLNNNNINNNIYNNNNNNTNINNINNHSNTNTHNIRSKSASTVLTSQNVKVTLPPMQTLHESSSNFSLLKNNKKSNIPELPLRLVQSAPSLSQSINLPPLHSTTISTSPTIITSSSSSTSSSVNLCPNNSTKIQQHSISNKLALKLHPNNLATSSSCNKLINSHQKRPSFEAYEQEGGILAPRR